MARRYALQRGSAEIDLTAPTTGTYAGVLMYGDRDQGNADNIFNGTADSNFTGALYFPTQQVTVATSRATMGVAHCR
ncbi:MAG: hypothetical protein R3C30_05945 [Hyphomonadaceae bacterium]